MTASSARRAVALWAGVLLATLAWIYAPALDNSFVWDDWSVVVATREARTLDAPGLRWAASAFVHGHYQPLTWLSLALDDRLGGGAPRAYHATNVLLHAANALLVALAAWLTLSHVPAFAAREANGLRLAASLGTATLFALHPMRVESVAWATERRDVLSAALLLVSLCAYLRARQGVAQRALLALAVLAHAAALLAKAQLMLPAVLLVLDAYPLRRHLDPQGRPSWRAWRTPALEKLPFVVPAALAGVLALHAQALSGAFVSWHDHGLAQRVAQAAYGLAFYVRATWALAWSPLYERPWRLDPLEPRFLLAAAAVLAALAFLARPGRAKALRAAALVYALWLLPVLGLAQSGVQLVADRYAYLACVSAWLLVSAWTVKQLARRHALLRAGVAAAMLAVCALWALLARAQVAVWHDDYSLWRHVLAHGPSALAANNLGQMLGASGQIAASVDHLQYALETAPTYARPFTALDSILTQAPQAVPAERARRLCRAVVAAAAAQPRSVLAARVASRALRLADLPEEAARWSEEAERRRLSP